MKHHPAAEAFPLLSEARLLELAEDIRTNGQQMPIVVWRGAIVDGRNRWRACEIAGVEPLMESKDFKDDADVARFVFSTNMQRRDLSETQRARAAAILLPMFAGKIGRPAKEESTSDLRDFSVRRPDAGDKAAARANVGAGTVWAASKVMRDGAPCLDEAMRDDVIAATAAVKLVKEAPEVQVAVVERLRTKQAKTPKQALNQLKTEAIAAKAASAPPSSSVNVLTGDSSAVLVGLTSRSIHCVVTDPPYGLDDHHSNHEYRGTDYADGHDYACPLLRSVCEQLVRVCAADAHLYFFSGYTNAWVFKQILGDFFDVQDNPIIWKKSTHAPCDFEKRYPNSHEYIWFARMRGGQRRLSRCVLDVIECQHERATSHSAEKPTALLQTLIEQSSLPGEHVLDPFCGSGSTGVAAVRTKRLFTGIELDEEWARVARGRLAA